MVQGPLRTIVKQKCQPPHMCMSAAFHLCPALAKAAAMSRRLLICLHKELMHA